MTPWYTFAEHRTHKVESTNTTARYETNQFVLPTRLAENVHQIPAGQKIETCYIRFSTSNQRGFVDKSIPQPFDGEEIENDTPKNILMPTRAMEAILEIIAVQMGRFPRTQWKIHSIHRYTRILMRVNSNFSGLVV